MSKERQTDFVLPKLDELFTSQSERDNGMMPHLQDIPLNLLDDFPNHPFKVRDDEDMLKLTESITERGVLVPAIVRPKADGRYELISGHRRKRASAGGAGSGSGAGLYTGWTGGFCDWRRSGIPAVLAILPASLCHRSERAFRSRHLFPGLG